MSERSEPIEPAVVAETPKSAPAAAAGDPGIRAPRQSAPTAHDVPAAIQWHEGMLLAPQHFQLASRRQEALLHYHAASLSPFHWGVRHLRIDPVRLVEGVFRVLELEAVMPDGLLVSIGADEGPELTLRLGDHADRLREGAVPVHLAVVARRSSTPVDADGARFRSFEGRVVSDENTGDGEMRLPRLRPQALLILGEEVPAKYTSFPLAEVRYGDETFLLTDFVPPSLRVAPGSPLARRGAEVASRLREKALFLAEQAREPSSAVRVPQLLQTKAMIQSLCAALPPIEALLYSGAAHPFALYLAFCSAVGHVAAIGRALVPPVFEAYDHDDPRTSFERIFTYITRVLAEGISEAYTAHSFHLAEGSFFLRFDREWLSRTLILGVRGRSGASERELEAWIEGAVIASRPKIPELQTKRIRGLERRRIEAESELAPARGVQLYALSADTELLIGDELLEVRNLDDPEARTRPAEVLLYVRNAG